MGHWVRGEGSYAADRPEPASWGQSLSHLPPLVRLLKVPSGAHSAGASSPVGTGLANSGRRVERLPLMVGMGSGEGGTNDSREAKEPPPSAHSPSLLFDLSLDSAMHRESPLPLGRGVCGCELWEQETNVGLVRVRLLT